MSPKPEILIALFVSASLTLAINTNCTTIQNRNGGQGSTATAEDFIAFISYRRSASKHLAMLIKVMLFDKGFDAFIDVEDLGGGFWADQLNNGVINTPNFILVLSNGTLDRMFEDWDYSDFLHKEIKLAVDSERRIIPVFDDNFEFPPDELLSPEVQTALKFQGVSWQHALTECNVDRIIEYFTPGETTTTTWAPITTTNLAQT